MTQARMDILTSLSFFYLMERIPLPKMPKGRHQWMSLKPNQLQNFWKVCFFFRSIHSLSLSSLIFILNLLIIFFFFFFFFFFCSLESPKFKKTGKNQSKKTSSPAPSTREEKKLAELLASLTKMEEEKKPRRSNSKVRFSQQCLKNKSTKKSNQ